MKTTNTTARSWNLNGLLHMSREKALKTSGNSTTTMRNWIVDDLLGDPLLEEVENRRHFRQLFRQLRVATQTSRRNIVRQDLRHFDNRLRVRPENVEELHEVRQLFHHLRHRCIQNLYHRGINGNLLHGTQLIPLLWPPRLTQTGWPGTPRWHLIFVGKCVVLGASVLLSPWGVVLGPGRLVG